ncbi:response regulator [Amycolatopsis magusensis]|uniref:DNA-binding NarL/FixJ family response regulator n=1 Tax=Amycolatopsis magusensis TaxID=882444 RepID=A0ABS4PT25_9PSEU|nr:response regulator transcription factor [Amycolatopsis magusensis]MBP2181751.1 DNA-binding NarL/FixJ family response regulator [Amycolatopsis magusensis]MDI5981073.1 response regulator transcription factor [Amycolatopsis magusensis]
MTIRVVLVDDHPLYRYGARFAIEDAEDLVIVGEASTGEEALQVVREKQVDVVLMDIQLPDRSGLEVTRAITGDAGPRVIVVSVNEDDDSIVSALRAGAHGYLVKGVSRDELLWAIRTVAAGGAVFGPSIADRLSNYFSAVHELPSRAAFPTLTNRERQVLDLIARGCSNRRIARQLVVSEKTVRNHITRVFTKLQVSDREMAMVRARDAGMGA